MLTNWTALDYYNDKESKLEETISDDKVPDEVLPDIEYKNNLKHFRVSLRLSQKTMAGKIGCSQAMYSMLETNNRMISSSYIGKMEAAFGRSFRDLYPRLFIGVAEYKQSVFALIEEGEVKNV